MRLDYYITPVKVAHNGRNRGRKYYDIIYYTRHDLDRRVYLPLD